VTRLVLTIVTITAAWSLASLGYYRLLGVLDAEIGYNDAPLIYSAYYAVWAALVYLVFRRSFAPWSRSATPSGYALPLGVIALLFTGYALFVLPHLPNTVWTREETPVEFFSANAWYFLPKSFEILFQQVLLVALILALNALGLSIRQISVLVGVLFGAFHLSLALNSYNPLYVFRYSIAATIFGAIVPTLILKMRNGFLISYALHWGYYAVDIAAIHLVFAAR
jgi:hypothetical protein